MPLGVVRLAIDVDGEEKKNVCGSVCDDYTEMGNAQFFN
jgi:hypothetical protein